MVFTKSKPLVRPISRLSHRGNIAVWLPIFSRVNYCAPAKSVILNIYPVITEGAIMEMMFLIVQTPIVPQLSSNIN